MKKVLFVINTLGGAGAERALLELLKRFSPQQYEIDLYVLLDQGELIHEVPEYVNLVNGEYFAESVLSAEGKKKAWKNGLASSLAAYGTCKEFHLSAQESGRHDEKETDTYGQATVEDHV